MTIAKGLAHRMMRAGMVTVNTIFVILIIIIIINKGAGKGAAKEKGVTMTIAKGLRIVRHHQGHNSGSRVKMMQIHLLKNKNDTNTSFENMYNCTLLDML